MRRMTSVLMLAAAFIATSSQAQSINIWPGVAPGSEHWTQKEMTIPNTPVGTVIMNVVTPTITPYLPPRGKATGAGVIIAPGGAFVALAISLEATRLATWLQQRGIAAFVLKYRTVEKKTSGIPDMDMDTARRYGIADGIQAIKLVRQHAREWGIGRARLASSDSPRGAWSPARHSCNPTLRCVPISPASIYGAPFGVMPSIPAQLPPTFMAWAQDDQVALEPVRKFYAALIAAATSPRPTFTPAADTASAWASRGSRATTGSTISTTGCKSRGSPKRAVKPSR